MMVSSGLKVCGSMSTAFEEPERGMQAIFSSSHNNAKSTVVNTLSTALCCVTSYYKLCIPAS